MHKFTKVALIIGITITLLTPIPLVLADDTESPVISSILYWPHAGVLTSPGFHLFQSCNVTDNVSVAEVRINISGPVGFVPINATMVHGNGSYYYFQVHNVTISGAYWFYIWAIDTSNNTAISDTYPMLVFEEYLNYIHVNGSNTGGPWYGTALHPLRYIDDALAVIATNGTIFIHNGVYLNTSILLDKPINLIGENQDLTILDGGGIHTHIINTDGPFLINLVNITLQNAKIGIHGKNGSNTVISKCTFRLCTNSSIILTNYTYLVLNDCTFQDNNKAISLKNCSYNTFYHNNFINNMLHVSSHVDCSNNNWDNTVTGNYWDDYRIKYPGASVIPSTGTWNIPYVVNASGDNIDNHPWVYPSGPIDTVPPQVTVMYPNGGELVSGEVVIEWFASDDFAVDLNGAILLEYSADNGATWNQIASQIDNTGSYVWNTTTVPDGTLYLIGISAIDEFLNIGSDTSDYTFSINNFALGYPQISGPTQGGNGIPLVFTAVYADSTGDQLYYKWDWGDGNQSIWFGPYLSDVAIATSYEWAYDGNYSVRVKAKNTNGIETVWSSVHLISIAEQVNFSNMRLGHIYFKLFTFNRSFIFSDFLARLGVVIVFTSHQMELEGTATDIVQSVAFRAENQMKVKSMEVIDDNTSDGFSCLMNITRGIYVLNISAYDGNGTLLDKYSLATVFFIRIGRYATDPIEPLRSKIQPGRISARLRR